MVKLVKCEREKRANGDATSEGLSYFGGEKEILRAC